MERIKTLARDVTDSFLAEREKMHERLHGFLSRMKRHTGLLNAIGWQKEGFDLLVELKNRSGPFIEVGGPTLSGYDIISKKQLAQTGKPMFASNNEDGLYHYVGPHRKSILIAKADFVADARELPLQNSSVGAVFASCLPHTIRKETIHEAARVLEQDGLLIWQGAFIDDLEWAKNAGLTLVGYEWELPKSVTASIPANRDVSDPTNLQEGVINLLNSNPKRESKYPQGSYVVAPDTCIFRKEGMKA